MYTNKFPLTSMVHEDEMGVNAPFIHQRTIAQLTAGLYPLYKTGKIPFEPLPEMMLTEGYATPVPDVLLYEYEKEQTRIIIEICQTSGQKRDLTKIIKLIDEDLYGILEGFVYNYKTAEWFRYRKGDGGLIENSSFSEILQLDLNSFLN
ncbi:hypothetical protein [Larkinella terrae]|uniref:Uma2 family endonuclease n=1 Tax=Larkinella terrae TaxID=2025311 RepID=A0A7K0ER19_9BACT|nr:hypothetical protein [Larkinella terrae]MRS64247.1 hypothetical protein [Larkinella terrae]